MATRGRPRAPGPWTELLVLTQKDGHTLASLGRVAGYSRFYMAQLARGDRTPNARVIATLAHALNVPKSVLEPRYAEPHPDAEPEPAAS